MEETASEQIEYTLALPALAANEKLFPEGRNNYQDQMHKEI